MVPAPDFTGLTQPLSGETATADWFTVSALIVHLVHPQNFDCTVFRRFSGYATLRSPCTTPTPLHSLPRNPNTNILDSSPLRCNSGSGSRHIFPTPTCPRLLARSASEHDRILRQQCEELHPPLLVKFHCIQSFGFIDSFGAMERKQRDGLIERWSHVVSYGGSRYPAGAFVRDVSLTSSSFCEH